MANGGIDKMAKWEKLLYGVAMVVFLLVICFLVTVATASKHIEYYYVQPDMGSTNALCIWARRSWASDIKCYCSDDSSKVFDALMKLKGVNYQLGYTGSIGN